MITRQCRSCGKILSMDSFIIITDRRVDAVCKECVEKFDKFKKCSICGNYFHSKCTCNNRRQAFFPRADSWNRRVLPKAIGPKPWAGFELEIELEDEDSVEELQEVYKKIPWIYTKYDGSIISNIEIVTEPISIELLNPKNEYYLELRKLLVELKAGGAISEQTTTCGLHIHISIEMFSDESIRRLLFFFENNKKKIATFARRTDSEVNRWAQFPPIQELEEIIKNKYFANRHLAINLNNTHTVEFRIFKGTLNPLTLFASLQFIISLNEILLKSDIKEWDEYIKIILKENNKNYEDLIRYVRYYI